VWEADDVSLEGLDTAKQYLTASDDGYWRWTSDGEAIVLPDDTTIAFRMQLLKLLSAFFPTGLPPFEIIVLILTICRIDRPEWPPSVGNYIQQFESLRRSSERWASMMILTLGGQLLNLPKVYRSTVPGLQAILRLSTEGFQTTSASTGAAIHRALKSESLIVEHIAGKTIGRSLSDRARDLEQLARNTRRVTEENVRRMMTVGHVDLPEPVTRELVIIPDPAPVIEPAGEPLTVPELLKELQQHEQHAVLVRLVKEIRAAVSFPRRIVPGDDLGLGGVSDLTNRGEFDRLLLSELAQDDDVLTIRVALREAMYLRREAPPSPPAEARALLIDHGLRMWGQPRFLACAVMLAFMVEHEALGGLKLFRSVRGNLQSVTVQSTAELEEHISALDPSLHCGDAIRGFADACRENRWEPILVTSEESYSDEGFRRPLREAGFGVCYVAVVDRNGRLRLLSRSERGERQLRTAVFDLHRRPAANILPASRPEAVDVNRPAILKRRPFPLHLSCDQPSVAKLLPLNEFHREGVAGLTVDRRLVLWEDRSSGGPRQIFDRLPGGLLHWWGMGHPQRDELLLVLGEPSHGNVHLVRASLDPNGDCEVFDLRPADGLTKVTYFQDHLFLIRKKEIDVFEVQTGRWVNSTPIPGDVLHHKERFFRSNGFAWMAMSFDGSEVRFDDLGLNSNVAAIFDCEPLGCPVAIDYHGGVLVSGAKEPRHVVPKTAYYYHAHSVTRDGREVRLQATTLNSPEWLVTFPEGKAVENPGPTPGGPMIPTLRPVLRKLTQICVFDGRLSLRTKSGRWLTLAFDRQAETGMQLLDSKACKWAVEQVFQVDVLRGQGYGYSIRPATFKDGSRIFVDSRGLLHFQSSDRGIPEFSLVSDTGVAGWVSDGRVWGNPWYLGASKSVAVEAKEIWDELIVPFVARLA
jgi:hypothetical protein